MSDTGDAHRPKPLSDVFSFDRRLQAHYYLTTKASFVGIPSQLTLRLLRFLLPSTPEYLTRMRVFSSTYTFDYSWPEVSTANWQKYCPWNKTSSHVIAVDTLSREVDPVTGIVRNP